jgi:phage baseplate assembly protein W
MQLDFPFRIDGRGGAATTNDEDHIRDMIEQFLFTNAGERVNRPEFGSGLLQMVFAPNSPELASALQFTIQSGLQRWLGDLIDVQLLEVRADDALLEVDVRYLIRSSQRLHERRFARGIRP